MDIATALENRLINCGLITEELRPSRRIKDAVVELSDAFTRERAGLRENYFDDRDHRDAYLAGFVLTNAAKVRHCLIQHIGLLPAKEPLKILDVGSGPGTGILAASELLDELRPGQEVRFLALESNRAILETARELSRNVLPPHHVAEWVACDMTHQRGILGNRRFDLVTAVNALSEIGTADEQLHICRDILSRSTAVIVIEPALWETARELMTLRDALCKNGFPIEAPCTHQRGCPMLKASERNWCHFYIEWQRPRLIEMLDHATGLNHRHLKMAYITIHSQLGDEAHHRGGVRSQSAPPMWRVVSSPLVSKGKIELVLCGGDGELKRVRRLDRDASPANADFDRVKRGDLVTIAEGEFRAAKQF